MIKYTRILLTGTLALITISTSAQEKLSLSLDSAQYYAIEYNKKVVNAGLAVNEANKALWETIAQGLPQLDATLDYSNYFGSSVTFQGMDITFDPTSNLNVTASQLIFSGSYIVGIQTAKLYKEMSETNEQKSIQDIKSEVSTAYFHALVAEKSYDIALKNLENLNSLYNKTQTMVNVGIAEQTDADQVSVQVNMLENAVRAAERQIENAYNMLKLQLGVTADYEIKLLDSLGGIINKYDFQSSIVSPFNIADNLDYQLMQVQEEVSEKQVNMRKAACLPTISGFYNYTEKIRKPVLDFSPKHVIGANVSIPIFAGGMRKAQVDQAKIQLKTVRNEKELLTEQLQIQEKQLRYNLKNAVEQYENQLKNVEVAERVYNSNRQKYEQGMISSLDLTTSHNNYLEAENTYISSLLQLLKAQIALEKLLNEL